MRAFIIRPFGKKNDIDFDEVEKKLIDPALNQVNITGRTTMEIRRQGNIRLDMFQRLLTADLVIADISIHNANVYYELGVRHALRGKHTFLIRARRADVKSEDVPFDLKTDRYLSYDADDPAASLAEVVAGLRQTLNSEEHDSPVFQMLPDLAEQDRARFLPIPRDFREEVERAAVARQVGDLELLADEIQGFEWEIEGLRVIGRALFGLGAHTGGSEVWEQVRGIDPLDLEANSMLGTIYQRLKDLIRSDQALNRVLTRKGLTEKERAELYSLLGRNSKARWRDEWEAAPDAKRQTLALSSVYLHDSYEAYDKGFIEDLNHFYSGLNALALLKVTEELARACLEVWEGRFDTEAQSRYELEAVTERIQQLASGVALSLRAENERLKRVGKKDVWVEVSEADLCFLTSKRPARVASAYREALAGAAPFVVDSARSQILIYKKLGIMTENIDAALSVLGEDSVVPAGGAATVAVKVGRILLFTGHMVDAPNRSVPRFPPDKEPVARQAIKEAVKRELALPGGIAYGIAGGASGGDILFHEVCAELGVETKLFLAMDPDEYVQHSVQAGGPQWVERFWRLCDAHKPRVLSESPQEQDYIPRWLHDKRDYGIWQRNSLWMLHNALAARESSEGLLTLIALWDGKAGDGPGGTADLVEKATQRGAKTIILNTTALFAQVEKGQKDPTVIASIVRPLFETASQTERTDSATREEPAKAVEVIKEKAPSEEPEVFDVFLSYNRSDGVAVEELAKQLKALGVKPWLDIWQLRPGLPWQDELERQIESIKSAAVFVGKEGIGPWQDIEQDAFLREFRKRRCPVIPVILPEAGTEPKLPIFLTGMTWVDFRSKDSDPMGRLIWGITGKRGAES